MKPLTPQQEKFAQLVASGKNQSDAYREAYPKSQKWKPDAVHNAGFKMMAIGEVSERVESLRKPIVDAVSIAAKMTIESHLAEMERIKKLAEGKEEYNVALKAEELRGKAVGYYVNRTEDVTDPLKKAMGNMTPEKAAQMLAALDKVEAIREKANAA